MTDTPMHSVSVAGVVLDDEGKVLVIQRRDNGRWEPPGGVLELRETPEVGVAREVLEETGIRVSVQSLSGVYKNMQRGIISLVFRCKAIGGEEQLTDESAAIRWLPVEEVKESCLPAYAVRITDAFELDVNVRAHDGTNVIQTDATAEASVPHRSS